MIRTITDDEKSFISGVDARLDIEAQNTLMRDLAIAQVQAEWADGEVIRFFLEGHEHPHRGGQRLYPIEGEVNDEDGSVITLLLFSDAADRLYELEYLRWEDGPLQHPDWSTLRFIPDVPAARNDPSSQEMRTKKID